jgi:flavin reductase (DIM6/NTAB) family NADH-FMN oxidoreductase RutF
LEDRPVFVDLLAGQGLRHSIFNAIVAPRPIAWVSSTSPSGAVNLAPFSYFNLLSSNPPLTVFSCTAPADRAEKDTLANIRATGEFVIHVVPHALLPVMHGTSAPVPAGVDEFTLLGIERAASVHVRPPRVAAAPAALECRLVQLVEVDAAHRGRPDCTAVIGRVVGLHVDPRCVNAEGRFDTAAADLVARLGGNQYARIGAVEELASLVHREPPLP